MRKRILTLALSAIVVSACSSTPDPEPPVQTVAAPSVPAPQPVAQPDPTPAPSIVANPNPVPVITNTAIPGSVEDFLFASGGEGRVFFAYNQHDLSSDARSVLARQAAWLQTYSDVVVVIEGNADERGTREYNLALGSRRAESVKSFLVSQGVSPNRLTTVSFGKERPIDGRSTEAGWARNRNAHTSLISGTIG